MPTATMPGQAPSEVPEFDASRAILKGPDMFTRFRVTDEGESLASAGLRPDAQLIVFQLGRHRRAFDRLQMAYRHIAQGEVDGQTFVVAYCGVCNMAAGLTPVVDGRVHHFSLGGVYNGMMLMIDDETHTYWDFVTGQARHGKLEGVRLDTWGVTTTTVKEALRSDPDLQVYLCPSPFFGRLVGWVDRYFSGWLPPVSDER